MPNMPNMTTPEGMAERAPKIASQRSPTFRGRKTQWWACPMSGDAVQPRHDRDDSAAGARAMGEAGSVVVRASLVVRRTGMRKLDPVGVGHLLVRLAAF